MEPQRLKLSGSGYVFEWHSGSKWRRFDHRQDVDEHRGEHSPTQHEWRDQRDLGEEGFFGGVTTGRVAGETWTVIFGEIGVDGKPYVEVLEPNLQIHRIGYLWVCEWPASQGSVQVRHSEGITTVNLSRPTVHPPRAVESNGEEE